MATSLENPCSGSESWTVLPLPEAAMPKTNLPRAVAELRLLDQLTQAAQRHRQSEGVANKMADWCHASFSFMANGIRSNWV
jgi:hypothetical protein